jgi:hypothetical protein
MRVILPTLLAWIVCTAALSAPNAAPRSPNVLLIISDDQRPDTIGALGNPVTSSA